MYLLNFNALEAPVVSNLDKFPSAKSNSVPIRFKTDKSQYIFKKKIGLLKSLLTRIALLHPASAIVVCTCAVATSPQLAIQGRIPI